MKNNSFLWPLLSAAKYTAALLIIVYIMLLFRFAGVSAKPFGKVRDAMEALLEGNGLIKADDMEFKHSYGLNAPDYEGVMYYRALTCLSAEEILLIEAKNKEQVSMVRRAVEMRLKERGDYFAAFAPDEAKLIDGARLSVRGNYIFLAVSDKAGEYLEAFSKNL